MFARLSAILVGTVTELGVKHWLPMAEQAVNVIYKLAEHPDILCGDLIKQLAGVVMRQSTESAEPQVDNNNTNGKKCDA